MLVKSPVANYEVDHRVAARQKIELHIAKLFIRAALKAGYAITVNDGEATPIKYSQKERDIIKVMFSVDDEYLELFQPYTGTESTTKKWQRVGWAQFIYGNDGWDVISDYTTNLEPLMVDVTAYQTKHGY